MASSTTTDSTYHSSIRESGEFTRLLLAQHLPSTPSTIVTQASTDMSQSLPLDSDQKLTQPLPEQEHNQTDVSEAVQDLQEKVAFLEDWQKKTEALLSPPDSISLSDQLQFNISTTTRLSESQNQISASLQHLTQQAAALAGTLQSIQERLDKSDSTSKRLSDMLL